MCTHVVYSVQHTAHFASKRALFSTTKARWEPTQHNQSTLGYASSHHPTRPVPTGKEKGPEGPRSKPKALSPKC